MCQFKFLVLFFFSFFRRQIRLNDMTSQNTLLRIDHHNLIPQTQGNFLNIVPVFLSLRFRKKQYKVGKYITKMASEHIHFKRLPFPKAQNFSFLLEVIYTWVKDSISPNSSIQIKAVNRLKSKGKEPVSGISTSQDISILL